MVAGVEGQGCVAIGWRLKMLKFGSVRRMAEREIKGTEIRCRRAREKDYLMLKRAGCYFGIYPGEDHEFVLNHMTISILRNLCCMSHS